MNRTIQNYQKAYRKKVEGLKIELSGARTDNARLKKEVRSLRRKRMVHLPSAVLGLATGWLTHRLLVRVLDAIKAPRASKQQQEPALPAAEPSAQPPAAAAAPAETASEVSESQ
jgi:hypothetical protein